jgi:hypothetical protein
MIGRLAHGSFTVVCIDDYYDDTLTIGKEYEVGIYDIIEQGSPDECYIIENDLGYMECYYTDSFTVITKSLIRNIKLQELGI